MLQRVHASIFIYTYTIGYFFLKKTHLDLKGIKKWLQCRQVIEVQSSSVAVTIAASQKAFPTVAYVSCLTDNTTSLLSFHHELCN